MSVANTSFKVGDRVRYFEDNGIPDYGTIMQDDVCNERGWKLTYPDSIWVKWESDGEILQVRAYNVELADSQQVPSKLTVQTCIDFLISQGYAVSLSKN